MGSVLYLCVIRAQTDAVSTTGFPGRHDRNLRPNDEYLSDLVRNERKANIDLIRLQWSSSVTGATFWDIYTYTGTQMVNLSGVGSSNQWRKYINGESLRTMSLHILFYMAAQLALSIEELDNVVAKMIEIGASINN